MIISLKICTETAFNVFLCRYKKSYAFNSDANLTDILDDADFYTTELNFGHLQNKEKTTEVTSARGRAR